jgi:hypothetical protein
MRNIDKMILAAVITLGASGCSSVSESIKQTAPIIPPKKVASSKSKHENIILVQGPDADKLPGWSANSEQQRNSRLTLPELPEMNGTMPLPISQPKNFEDVIFAIAVPVSTPSITFRKNTTQNREKNTNIAILKENKWSCKDEKEDSEVYEFGPENILSTLNNKEKTNIQYEVSDTGLLKITKTAGNIENYEITKTPIGNLMLKGKKNEQQKRCVAYSAGKFANDPGLVFGEFTDIMKKWSCTTKQEKLEFNENGKFRFLDKQGIYVFKRTETSLEVTLLEGAKDNGTFKNFIDLSIDQSEIDQGIMKLKNNKATAWDICKIIE